MSILLGPAGLGPVKEAVQNLKKFHSLGLKACEIAFTYGVYIKNKEDALAIGKEAEKLGVILSIHAPYWVNLNSLEKIKVKQTKERILKCCEVGTWLKAKRVVFHPGYYGKLDKEQTYENVKQQIIEMQKEIKHKKYTTKLAPEMMGKVNVFGTIDDIYNLVNETGCDFCIDFAHILARYKEYKFREVFDKFKEFGELHIHFSGIEYGEKGEKHHKKTPENELKKLVSSLPKNKDIIIINESPEPVEDSVMGIKLLKSIS